MAVFAESRPVAFPPGTHWAYASGTTLVIADLIRSVLADDSAYARFPREALFDRIGMSSAVIETDAGGTFVGSSLMYATARDWARFGQLYLNDGMWNGERILPSDWIAYTRTPAPADSTHGYGAHFWLGVPTEPGAPVTSLSPGMLQAAGHEGQYLTILPIRDLVIVRLGRTRRGNWDHAAFVKAILAKIP
jgi:CubicO group peptidase (beta-lactamase class C family)